MIHKLDIERIRLRHHLVTREHVAQVAVCDFQQIAERNRLDELDKYIAIARIKPVAIKPALHLFPVATLRLEHGQFRLHVAERLALFFVILFLFRPCRKIYGAFVQLGLCRIAILLCHIFGLFEVALLLMFCKLVVEILDRRLRRRQAIIHKLLLLQERLAFRFREFRGHEFLLIRKILRSEILEEKRLEFSKFRFSICNVAIQIRNRLVKRNFHFTHLLFQTAGFIGHTFSRVAQGSRLVAFIIHRLFTKKLVTVLFERGEIFAKAV